MVKMMNSQGWLNLKRVTPALCASVILCLIVFCGTGCERAEDQTQASQKTIGVTLLTVQHQFYQDLRAGLQEEANRYGYRLLVSTAEFDPARQANQIDEFIVQRIDALVVCPCDSRSVGASILAANEAGIAVFTADIGSASPLGKVTTHIASDNVQGGRAAAKLLAQAIGDTGKVAILSHPEVASVTDRVRGFKEEMARHEGISGGEGTAASKIAALKHAGVAVAESPATIGEAMATLLG